MPFYRYRKIAKKPQKTGYPVDPQTLGEHIKKARLDQELLQRDTALRLSVCEDTITGWENGRYTPLAHHYPAIIAFLGYYPFSHETGTIAGKLRQWRFCLGLTHNDSGAYLKADPRNVRDWERKKKMPSAKRAAQITKLWEQLPPHLKTPYTHETEPPSKKSGLV